MKKLAIVISHPIQYYAPVFQLIALKCDLLVFYTYGEENVKEVDDAGFKKKVTWDLPLLEGYSYLFVENTADKPGHYFNGIRNPSLIEKIKSFCPDAILIYGWAYRSHLSTIRHFSKKIPIWFRGDSTTIDESGWIKSRIKKHFLTWIYKHIDFAFYVGKQNKNYYKKFGVEEKQLIFAPHAIENERFGDDRSIEAFRLRKKLGISQHQILILYAGKFEEKKDPAQLLDVFIQLKHSSAHLLFVGNGALEENLKLKVAHLEQKFIERIHFLDFQNQTQMPVVYQACDLFCLPSKGPNETWGLAVNEAMAAAKAVLVSDKVGCAVDLVVEGKNGYVFEASNEQSLKQKLSVILESNLAQMGKFGNEIIKEWSFSNQVKSFISTFEKD
ncbi:glycosyltransferase family 4 protein [Pedobacter frigidisoli]|uniref:glycosyltransferase family 4 protein n=1 Tax=Pedobacter frigidisoli TaxID=2530455 RepID=UPI00293077E3|nr:glycosyltransferase family 4 protein [Pedobacter frigidisoli]